VIDDVSIKSKMEIGRHGMHSINENQSGPGIREGKNAIKIFTCVNHCETLSTSQVTSSFVFGKDIIIIDLQQAQRPKLAEIKHVSYVYTLYIIIKTARLHGYHYSALTLEPAFGNFRHSAVWPIFVEVSIGVR
jgi:hypothetical protein